MRGIDQLASIFFAASSPSLRTIVENADSLYRDLDRLGESKHYSPTIKFSFVRPSEGGQSWRDHDENWTVINDNDDIFESVSTSGGSSKKPIALYLPGLDGMGVSGVQQFDDLSRAFEFWRLVVSPSDRSSFGELTSTASAFVADVAIKHNREVVVIGESFGGLLAPAVALKVQSMTERQNIENPIRGLVMVNPATSFEETNWSTLGPLLASLRHVENTNGDEGNDTPRLPTPYSVVGGVTLAQLIPDSKQLQKVWGIMQEGEITTADDLVDAVASLGGGFNILAKNLPADTVEHRITRWLPVGSEVVNKRLSRLDVPTLVIAGQDDKMLPSQQEANRLVDVMRNAKKIDVRGSGHYVLDDRVNLTEAIEFSDIDPFNYKSQEKETMDPITDWKLPSEEEIREIIESRVEPLRRLTSPIFFSTDKGGTRRKGLSCLPPPSSSPLLLVANHQFGGLDLGMIIAQLIEDRGIAARGLAHPIIFQGRDGSDNDRSEGGNTPGIRQPSETTFQAPFGEKLFKSFGAVMVTPRNYYRLMQTGQTALLFPGGVREVFHGKNEAYQLLWPEKLDFVRTAAKFNATVVTLSAVGAADSVNILVDAPDMAKLPFGIGKRLLESSANITAARFNQDDEKELFAAPFSVPKGLPARHYFVFGKPISTSHVDHRDIESCKKLYQDVKNELERGFDDVLHAREKDPFSDSLRRLAYEQVVGKQAPTFSVAELNRQ